MKKLIWAICLLFINLTANAGINFLDNPVWSTVLEKAKKENKMIFLDAYATWCGPCKQMDSDIYTDKTVADYYNANFINVKYDMEKGEGVTLASKYAVTAYPYLLFIDADGVVLHKGIGYKAASEFVNLGKTALDPNAQYPTLKKNALSLSNAEFVKFAEKAVSFEDEDFEALLNEYLEKQADILGNNDLITLVMQYVNALPDENSLAYFKNNKAKVINSKLYTSSDFEERLVSLTLGLALSDNFQSNPDKLDFEAIKTLSEKYIPEKSFFLYNYFKVQFAIDESKMDEVIAGMDLILSNVPDKVTFDQACNAMINAGAVLLAEGKLDATLKKFEAIKLTGENAKNTYMKNYVVAIVYLKNKDFNKFKEIANLLIASTETPDSVKDDIKSALEKIK